MHDRAKRIEQQRFDLMFYPHPDHNNNRIIKAFTYQALDDSDSVLEAFDIQVQSEVRPYIRQRMIKISLVVNDHVRYQIGKDNLELWTRFLGSCVSHNLNSLLIGEEYTLNMWRQDQGETLAALKKFDEFWRA